MLLQSLVIVSVWGALATLVMTRRNLRSYAPPDDLPVDPSVKVSVCVPARDEAANLRPCVESILASDHANVEVLIYDDQSSDETPAVAAQLMGQDPRVRLIRTVSLPPGWNGKQHACAQMGFSAWGQWLIFTDADVRFEPDAVRRAVAFAQQRDLALASTFPRQITETWGERLLVPMIFFLLFSYLPMRRMRQTTTPSVSAGCGQFLLIRADMYRESHGHAAIPDSMHDGIAMPRLIRSHGGRTDLFDGTGVLRVRMYHGFKATWQGFVKNAYEGLGSWGVLLCMTVFHLLVFVAPWVLLCVGVATSRWWLTAGAVSALGLAFVQRFWLGIRFGHSAWLGVLHAASVTLTVALQWQSWLVTRLGRRSWRGRHATLQHAEQVILVNEHDEPIGEAGKLVVHEGPGQRHRAFSVLLFDGDGRVLLQKRASVKYHFAGRWANACCSHPRPGEDILQAAARRLDEELGVSAQLHEVGKFTYDATDESTGLVEREIDHVLVGRCSGMPFFNPLEVESVAWVWPSELDRMLDEAPEEYAPWLRGVWRCYQHSGAHEAEIPCSPR